MASAYSKLKVDFAKCATLPFTNSSGSTINGATVRRETQKLGMVLDDTANGDDGVMIVGAPEPGILFPKATGVALGKGQPVYWDIADGNLNASASGNIHVGYAYADAGSSDTEVQIVLFSHPIAT